MIIDRRYHLRRLLIRLLLVRYRMISNSLAKQESVSIYFCVKFILDWCMTRRIGKHGLALPGAISCI